MWQVAGASGLGAAHLAGGLLCQDAFAWRVARGCLILAVSDGAGRAHYAAEASALQCGAAVAWCAEHLEALNGAALVEHVQRQLQAAAGAGDLREWAATLCVLVLPGGGDAWCLSVGDSAAVVQLGGRLWPVFWPQDAEGYANQTHFVYHATPRTTQEVWLEGDITDAALFTDGLHPVALRYAEQAAHLPFFAPFFSAVAEEGGGVAPRLQRFLESPRLQGRSDDDKTLLLAVRR